MLPFFPRAYENELLYSVISRYHHYSGNLNIKDTTTDLFGKGKSNIIPDLTTDLNTLIGNIHHFSNMNVADWINHHTLYNYYTNFTNMKVKSNVLEGMTNSSGKHILHYITGQMAGNVKEHICFRYCPVCLKEDIEKFGETYWRTYHQLPSVFVCLEHSTILKNSSVLFRQRNLSFAHPSLKNCISNKDNDQGDFSKINFGLLLNIAIESFKITIKDYAFDQAMILKIYRYLLQLKGYVKAKGTIDQHKLREDFILFYRKDFLNLMQSFPCGVEGKCWLRSITRKHRKSFHPVRHLLLIHFLGESVDTIHQYINKDYNPFGEGPYPCLNPAASHYLKPVITNVEVTRCSISKKPVGTFYCSCGFVYSRKGPDLVQEDRQKIGRIKEFGHIWIQRLNHLIYVEKMSFRACARILKVDTKTVIKYVKNPEMGPKNKNEYLPENYREQWLELRSKNSLLSKTELRKINPSLYMVLYRNDKEWLNENSPTTKRTKIINKRIDWSKRDLQILNEVINAVKELNASNKPVRITKSSIGKAINRISLLEKKYAKLPLTMQYIDAVYESVEEFQKKRIRWAVNNLVNEELTVSRIRRKAGIRPCYYQNLDEEINNFIYDSLENQRKKR